MNSLIPLRYKDSFISPVDINYDKVVDTTDFKRSQDTERNALLTGDTGGSVQSGVYDFEDGNKVDMAKFPSDTILALRSGRVDKADVDTILRAQKENAENEVSDSLSAKQKEDIQKINAARQKFMDNEIGFNPDDIKPN